MKDDAKPQTLNGDLHYLPFALAPLIAKNKWVLWRWERSNKTGKWTKPPYQPNGFHAKNNDPKTWHSYVEVLKALPRWDGIGYNLLDGDIAAFDIDHCRDPSSGTIKPWATALVERANSYTEITVSGTGLRIIGLGLGSSIHKKFPVSDALSCEVYRNCERYIVVTGNPLPSTPQTLAIIDEVIDDIVREFGAKRNTKEENKPGSADDGGHHARQQYDSDMLWQAINADVPVGKRSDQVFLVVNEMFRRGYRQEAILKVLLNEKYKISDHIYDQAARTPHKYAQRQIDEAKSKVGLAVSEKNIPYQTAANICIALLLLGIELRYDEFADRILISGLRDFAIYNDAAFDRLWLTLNRHFRFNPGKDLLRTALSDAARVNSFHPVRDYLDGLQWDGKPRIDTWLSEYGGAEDTEYTRAVGALMLTAAVRRVRSPGCKFDEMVVIENEEQGTNKSTALNTLAIHEDWFSDDLPLNVTDKQVIERLRGRWIIEAAELSGMRRTDIEHLKAFLSRQMDRARMAYDRAVSEVPRQCIIVGTTNAREYLKDTSGNRRFWPVRVGQFNITKLRHNRDQLWAEAAAREAEGASIRLDPKLWPKAREEQEQRLTRDPWYDMLHSALVDMKGKITSASIWEILDVRGGQQTQEQNRRVNDAMRSLGWQRNKARTIKVHGNDVPGWTRGEPPWRLIIVDRYYGQLGVHYEPEPYRDLFTHDDGAH
jgi:hypothetical protein